MYIESFLNDIFSGVASLSEELDMFSLPRSYVTTPDNDTAYQIISIEVPGLKREDIDVSVTDRTLIANIKGKYNRKLQFFIPPEASTTDIKSKLEYGILEIKLVRVKENKRSIHIDVA